MPSDSVQRAYGVGGCADRGITTAIRGREFPTAYASVARFVSGAVASAGEGSL